MKRGSTANNITEVPIHLFTHLEHKTIAKYLKAPEVTTCFSILIEAVSWLEGTQAQTELHFTLGTTFIEAVAPGPFASTTKF